MNRLKKLLYIIPIILSYTYVELFKIINFKRKRILIYTDSRGFEITKLFNRKTPWNSYVNYFIRNYRCDVYICPEKHTTFFDFFNKLKAKKNLNYVICHIGVVDFSPRPTSDVFNILSLKRDKIIDLFGLKDCYKLMNIIEYPIYYDNQKTASIINEKYIDHIANKLNKIENLIWISCNPTVDGWAGNYSKERPINIGIVNDKSKKLINLLHQRARVVNMTNLNAEEVKSLTCDNIHLTKKGMNWIETQIKRIIDGE